MKSFQKHNSLMNAEILTVPEEKILEHFKGLLDKKAGSYDLICFDFFDTLVSRTVPPEDTKRAAAHQLAALLGDFVDGDLIYRLRAGLEKKLCAEHREAGKDAEFSIVELAEKLFEALRGLVKQKIPDNTHWFVEWVIDIELNVEKKVQFLNSYIFEALLYCRSLGVKTALISDFYIPEDYFNRLLKHHGLGEHFDYLFVSADRLETKGHSGKLYEKVIEEVGCEPDKMIMVGDNYRADCEMAKEKGITSVWLGPDARSAGYRSGTEAGVAGSSAEALYQEALEKNRTDCFPEVGLSLFLFTHRLYEQAVRDRCDALFFCSKEGEFLKSLFDQYQEIRFGRRKIDSHYLLVSRKATYICSLKELEEEKFDRLFCHYRNMSVSEFLKSLNFSDFEVDTICSEIGLEKETSYENFNDREEFLTLLKSDSFRQRYDSHRTLQKENFISYLKSFGFDYEKQGLRVVDVGWKGSIQNNIFLALGEEIDVCGYYIGSLGPTELRENNRKTGLLFSDYPQHSDFIHVYNNNRSLFEMVLGASHGSADGYFQKEQFTSAKRNEISCLLESRKGATNSIASPAILDLPEERKLFNRIIDPLQQEYLKLNARLTELLVSANPKLPSGEWFARMHARSVFMPTKKEVELYTGLYHLENFGVFCFTRFDLDKKVRLRDRIRNFLDLRKKPAAYLQTGVWPPIILQRLGLEFLISVDGRHRYNRIFGKDK